MNDFEDMEKWEDLFNKMEQSGSHRFDQMAKELRLDFEIGDMVGERLLSNMDLEEKEILLQCIKETGYDCFIKDDAYSRDDIKLDKCIGLFTKEIYRDHGPFWHRLTELRLQKNNI